MIENLYTRFRAYRMENGCVVSYSVDMEFVLIGGRYNDDIAPSIREEMRIAGCDSIDLLHIPSWNRRMCDATELETLLNELQPTDIEIPAYNPTDENGKACRRVIKEFCENSPISQVIECSYKKVGKEGDTGRGLLLSPTKEYNEAVDNDVVEFFYQGRFKILSTGFVKSKEVVDEINKKSQLHNPILLLVCGMSESPFISLAFIHRSHPLIIVDMLDNNKYYHRANADLKDYGISSQRADNDDLILVSGIRRDDNIIETPTDASIDGNDYKTE